MKKNKVMWNLIVVGTLILVNFSFFQPIGATVPPQEPDYVIDSFGFTHSTWSQLADFEYEYGNFTNYEVHYENDKPEMIGEGIFPMRVSHTPADSINPQIDINYNNWMIYVVWIELAGFFQGPGFYGEPVNVFMYSGSQNNGSSWADPKPSYVIENYNPEFTYDMRVFNNTLELIWGDEVQRVIEPDLDGDFIPDHEDYAPFAYDPDGMSIDVDVVGVNGQINISVALDYENNSTTMPIILEETPPPKLLLGGTNTYANITTLEDDNFTAIIKVKYNEEDIFSYMNETYLRVYTFSDGNWTQLDNTGINMMHQYIWGITDHFSLFTVADSSIVDSDFNGIPDAWDISISDNKRLTIYTEDSISPSIHIDEFNKFYMVWGERRDNMSRIFFKRSNDFGETWEVDTPITSNLNYEIRNVEFGADGSHLAVVWEEKWGQGEELDEYGYPIIVDYYHCYYIESFDSGDTWSTPEKVAPDDPPPEYPTGQYFYTAHWPSIDVEGEFLYISYVESYIYIPGVQGPNWRISEFVVLIWKSETESYREDFYDIYSEPLTGVSNVGVFEDNIHMVLGDNSKSKLYYFKGEDNGIIWNPEVVLSEPYSGPSDSSEIDLFVKSNQLFLVWSHLVMDFAYRIFCKGSNDNGESWTDGDRLLDLEPVMPAPTHHLSPSIIVDSENKIRMTYRWESDFDSNIAYSEFLPTHDILNNDLAFNEVDVWSSIMSGSYLDTHYPDDIPESVGETIISDPITMDTYSRFELKWVFQIMQASTHTFHIKASAEGLQDGEHILFQYSTDDETYINLDIMVNPGYPSYYQSCKLPDDLDGLVYIRALDSDKYWHPNEVQGILHVDHMYVESKDEPGDFIVRSISIGKDAVTPSLPSIALDTYENFHVLWQDYRESDWEIFWVKESSPEGLDIDKTINIITAYEPVSFNPLFGDSELMRELISNKLETLKESINSNDNQKSIHRLSHDIQDSIDNGIANQGLKSRTVNELTGVGDDLMGSPSTPNVWVQNSISCNSEGIYECVYNKVHLSWTAPGGNKVDGFNVYRCDDLKFHVIFCVKNLQNIGPSFTTSIIDYDVEHESLYTYYVKAYNSAGESPASDLIRVYAEDTAGPVIATIPNDGDEEVGVNSAIEVLFNEEIDQNTFNFELKILGDTTIIAGNSNWYNEFSWYVFTPFSSLLTSTFYEADVYAEDLAGNSNGKMWTFLTEVHPDDVPIILWTKPGSNDIRIDLDANIEVRFSRRMDATSVQSAFSYNDGANTWDETDGTFSWYDNNKRFVFDPSLDFSDGYNIEVTITTAAKSVDGCVGNNGCNLAEDYSWIFSTKLNSPVLKNPVLTSSEIVLSWDWSSDWDNDPSDFDFKVYKNGFHIGTTDSSTFLVSTDLNPQVFYSFRIVAINALGIASISPDVQIKTNSIEHYLDVGIGDGYNPDNPSQPSEGIYLIPEWSKNVLIDPKDGTDYRKQRVKDDPHDPTTPKFNFRIEVSDPEDINEVWAENYADYAITFRYQTSGTLDLYYQDTQNIGTLEGNNAWKVSTIVIDHNLFSLLPFYQMCDTCPYRKNVGFSFGTGGFPHWLFLDWIRVKPLYYHTEIGETVVFYDFNTNSMNIVTDINLGAHSPGMSLHPDDWDSEIFSDNGNEFRMPIEAEPRIYLNVPHYSYSIKASVEYRTTSSGVFGQWIGGNYVSSVNLIADGNWNWLELETVYAQYPSYEEYGNNHLNAILRFSVPTEIMSANVYSYGGDADGDGLTDWEEKNIGNDGYITDPANPDTDNDNLPDGLEIDGWDITVNGGSVPVYSNPLLKHTDSDGLEDYIEYLDGTNPNNVDTDNDYLTDNFEKFHDYMPKLGIQGTSPIFSDSDGDNLMDGIEYGDFDPYTIGYQGLNPLVADTDGDGIQDYNEYFILDHESVGEHPDLIYPEYFKEEIELVHTNTEESSLPLFWLPKTINWEKDPTQLPHLVFFVVQGKVEVGTLAIKNVILRGGSFPDDLYIIDECLLADECLTRWIKSDESTDYHDMFIFDFRESHPPEWNYYSISFEYTYIMPSGPVTSAWVRILNENYNKHYMEGGGFDRKTTQIRAVETISFENGLEIDTINGEFTWRPRAVLDDYLYIKPGFSLWDSTYIIDVIIDAKWFEINPTCDNTKEITYMNDYLFDYRITEYCPWYMDRLVQNFKIWIDLDEKELRLWTFPLEWESGGVIDPNEVTDGWFILKFQIGSTGINPNLWFRKGGLNQMSSEYGATVITYGPAPDYVPYMIEPDVYRTYLRI
jgi:hypothetical protein